MKEEERKKRRALKKEQEAKPKAYYGPTNLTEYLFADRYGEIAANINQNEINQIYMSYMQSLIDSYERLKSKFT